MKDRRAEDILTALRAHGGRVTRPRRLVIEALLQHPDHHVTAAEVVTTVRAADPNFYESTVYRTLDRLVELAVIERVQLGPGAAVFHLPHRPHLHLVCDQCGSITEVAPDLLDDLIERVRRADGFELQPSTSTLTGTCRTCRDAR